MLVTHRLLTSLLFFLSLAQSVQADITEETTPTQNATWAITFDLEEQFRDDEDLPRLIHLEVKDTGQYIVNYHVVSEDPTISALRKDEGVLEESMVIHLRNWLDILKSSDIPISEDELSLGYGTTLKPGWRGALVVQFSDSIMAVKFSSLRTQETQRTAAMNQLATLIFDLKRLSLAKFGLNRARTEKPADLN